MGNFTKVHTPLQDLFIIEAKVYGDQRGFFLESYSKKAFSDLGFSMEFVQDNHSRSGKNVLRGLHIQYNYPQDKLVRVTKGSVYDVCVDLRPNSPTFGQWYGLILSEENQKMVLIPKGFAHGFLTLEEGTEFLYKVSDDYHPEDEGGIIFNDSDLNIQWPGNPEDFIISKKDLELLTMKAYIATKLDVYFQDTEVAHVQ